MFNLEKKKKVEKYLQGSLFWMAITLTVGFIYYNSYTMMLAIILLGQSVSSGYINTLIILGILMAISSCFTGYYFIKWIAGKVYIEMQALANNEKDLEV